MNQGARLMVDLGNPGPVATGDASLEHFHRLAVKAATLESEDQYYRLSGLLVDLHGQVARHIKFLLALMESDRAGDRFLDDDGRSDLSDLLDFVASVGVSCAETVRVLENARYKLGAEGIEK